MPKIQIDTVPYASITWYSGTIKHKEEEYNFSVAESWDDNSSSKTDDFNLTEDFEDLELKTYLENEIRKYLDTVTLY